jgi:hypothetical protein
MAVEQQRNLPMHSIYRKRGLRFAGCSGIIPAVAVEPLPFAIRGAAPKRLSSPPKGTARGRKERT